MKKTYVIGIACLYQEGGDATDTLDPDLKTKLAVTTLIMILDTDSEATRWANEQAHIIFPPERGYKAHTLSVGDMSTVINQPALLYVPK